MTDTANLYELEIIRFGYTPFGTFGTMLLEGETLYTLEPPWLDNKPNVSCIPCGEYRCVPRRFHRGGYDTWEVQDVIDRSHILFHRGNTMNHTKGCIMLGYELGILGNTWSIEDSRRAVDRFLKVWDPDEYASLQLKIRFLVDRA